MLDLTYAFTRQPSRVWPRRNSRPELPGWLFKEGADEEDESGSEYDPAEELPEPKTKPRYKEIKAQLECLDA